MKALLGILLAAHAAGDAELEKFIDGNVRQTPIPAASAPLKTAPATAPSLPLVDAFSAGRNPGAGSLEFSFQGKTEKIIFGAGNYAMGMIFVGDTLPSFLQAELNNPQVIQIVLGNLAPKDKLAQFGALTLVTKPGKRPQWTLPLRIPAPGEKAAPETASLSFASPETPRGASDEDRLKTTFFAKEGYATLTVTSEPRSVSVALGGNKATFKMQSMRLELTARVATPFVSEIRELRGQIEFPVYWPASPAAKKITRRFNDGSWDASHAIRLPSSQSKTLK